MTDIKSKRWSFTSYTKPSYNDKAMNYLIWQKEYSTTNGLNHYQGYVELKEERRIFQVRSLLKCKGAHCEISIKSREANIFYCTKNESYAGERYEAGNINTGINRPIADQLDDVFNLK